MSGTEPSLTFTFPSVTSTFALPCTHEVAGCSECNRPESKPWPVYTVNYHGTEVCAKCLTPMSAKRRRTS